MEHYSEKGIGAYAKKTKGHKTVADIILPQVLAATGKIDVPQTGAFVLCDYGAADGGSSRDLITAVIGQIKNRDQKKEIQVFYDDLCNADFASLFKMLNDDSSYVHQYEGVYATAIGRSFLQQCLPSDSLHLGISTTSMHWMTKLPCKMKQSIFPHKPLCSEEEFNCFAKFAAQEWAQILNQRRKELTKGGRLVFCNISLALDNHIVVLAEQLWMSYSKKGIISEEEFTNTNCQMFIRTEGHIRAPFEEGNGLRITHLSTFTPPCPFLEDYLQTKEQDDTAAKRLLARRIVASCRTYSNSAFMNGLDPARSLQERERIVDQLFSDMTEILEMDPTKYTSMWENCVITIEKIA